MALTKKPRHLQSKYLVNFEELLKCIREVDSVEYVLAVSEDCNELVKISVANLAAQIDSLP